MSGWYGVDLDGTLAHYKGWQGSTHIGLPVEPMLERVKKWLKQGKTVKIMTARVNPKNADAEVARETISAWTEMYLGQALESTHEKDFGMIELYDDRAVQVVFNTGEIVGKVNDNTATQEEDIYK
jgi:hypothetical protein